MTRTSEWQALARLVRGLAIAGVGLFLIAYVSVAVRRAVYPFELEWMEGGGLEHVRRLVAGEQVYVRPTLAFIAYPYTPLYYYASAFVARASGHVDFTSMRAVSLAASLGVFALIAAIVQRAAASWFAAAVACGLMVASYGLTDGWFDVARVDSLFLCLLLAGVFALQRAQPSSLAAAGVWLALSFLVKQTAMLIAAPLVLWSMAVDRRRTAWLLVPAALIAVASTYYFQSASDGWYWYYIFELQRKVGSPIPARMVTFWTRDMLPMAIAAAAAGVFVLTSVRRHAPRALQAPLVACVAMIGAAWLSRVRLGNFVNVLMPAYAGFAILGGMALAGLERRWASSVGPRRGRVELVAGALAAAQLAILAVSFSRSARVPTPSDEAAGHRLVQAIAAFPGEVFVPCQGYLASRAGKPSFAHVWEIADVLDSGDPVLAPALRAELTESFRTQRFAAVLPCVAQRAQLEAAGLSTYYRTRESLFADGDRAFMPLAGYRVRSDAVLVPAPRPE